MKAIAHTQSNFEADFACTKYFVTWIQIQHILTEKYKPVSSKCLNNFKLCYWWRNMIHLFEQIKKKLETKSDKLSQTDYIYKEG